MAALTISWIWPAPTCGHERYVVPKLPSFRARYPNVVVEKLVSERTSNLVEEGIDLAIRNGALADSSLIARKIGEFAVVAVASAEYLAGGVRRRFRGGPFAEIAAPFL
jgi:DNA-binding transcriptional LysR family regulator